jgi:SAM-dependent methyltransferase
MNNQTIQRQYDEIIAPHYDQDAQGVLNATRGRAVDQLRQQGLLAAGRRPLSVLDVGVGTGRFLAQLTELAGDGIRPFGLDLSAKMIAVARDRVPDLVGAVDSAANLGAHFPSQAFDLISTHFVTGFVPISVLAPKIWDRLEDDGYWSLVAGTMAGFPGLRAKADGRLVRLLNGRRSAPVETIVCNPAGREEVVRTLRENGFAVRAGETFTPRVRFPDFEAFMDFAYRGGWLTPFIEAMGLHRTGRFTKAALNWLLFPVEDHHSIEVVLAQKKPR